MNDFFVIWCSSCDRLSPGMNAVIAAVLTECTMIADGGVARLRVYGHVYRNWADIATDEVRVARDDVDRLVWWISFDATFLFFAIRDCISYGRWWTWRPC